MPRIYKDVKPPQNKAADPVKETKKATKEKPAAGSTGKKENDGE